MNFDNVCNLLSFEKGANGYYKKVDKYLFSLLKTTDNKIILVSELNHSFDNSDEVFNEMQKRLKIKLASGTLQNNTLIIKIDGKKDEELSENIASVVKELIEYFELNNIDHSHQCKICHMITDEVIDINGICTYGHKECKENLIKEAVEEIDNNPNVNPNKLTSVVLSFIGAFIGIIPIVVIVFFTSTFYSLLFILPPLASFFGYKLGKAKLDKLSTILPIIFSFISVMFSYFLILLIIADDNPGVTVKDLFLSDIVTFIYVIGFYVLGVVFSYRTITKNNNENVKKRIKNI